MIVLGNKLIKLLNFEYSKLSKVIQITIDKKLNIKDIFRYFFNLL